MVAVRPWGSERPESGRVRLTDYKQITAPADPRLTPSADFRSTLPRYLVVVDPTL
jgi:hypothetical protein